MLTCSALLGLEHHVSGSWTSLEQQCCSFISASPLGVVSKPVNVQNSNGKKGVDPVSFLSFCRNKQSLSHPLSLLFSVGFLISEMYQFFKKSRAFHLFRLWQKHHGSSKLQWWHLRPQQGTSPIRFFISANQCCVLMPLTLLQFCVQFIQFYLVIIELGS